MGPDLTRAGVVAIFGMLVSLAPLAAAVAYMLRPSEGRLAIMRPLSLATIFAALHTFLYGVAAVLRNLPASRTSTGFDIVRISHGLSESVTPVFVAFGFLTAAWICVAVGIRRQG